VAFVTALEAEADQLQMGPIRKKKTTMTTKMAMMDDVIDELRSNTDRENVILDNRQVWLEPGGQSGCFLLNLKNDKLHFGCNDSWSPEMALTGIGFDKRPFEITCKNPKAFYELCLCNRPLPGAFKQTSLVKVFPRFMLLNCMADEMYICQVGFESSLTLLEPFSALPWHRTNGSSSANIKFRHRLHGDWSIGSIDINEIGSYGKIKSLEHVK
jgi:hypothetical protein